MEDSQDTTERVLVSAGTARTLAEYGITLINSSNGVVLKRDAKIIARLSRRGSRMLGPSVAVLDVDVMEGVLSLQTRMNIEYYKNETNDLEGVMRMRAFLRRGDHLGVMLVLLENGYPYRSIHQLRN